MRGFLTLLSAFLLLAASPGHSAGEPDRGAFRSTAAQAAQNKFARASAEAQAVFDRAMSAAKSTYSQELTAALQEATRAGNLEAANKIDQAIKRAKSDPPADAGRIPIPAGAWDIEYLKGGITRTLRIAPDGSVLSVSLEVAGTVTTRGHLFQRRGDLILDLGDERLDRLTVINKRMIVEHFFPADTYPDKLPSNMGLGRPAASP